MQYVDSKIKQQSKALAKQQRLPFGKGTQHIVSIKKAKGQISETRE